MFKEYVRADEYLITALLYLPKDMDVKTISFKPSDSTVVGLDGLDEAGYRIFCVMLNRELNAELTNALSCKHARELLTLKKRDLRQDADPHIYVAGYCDPNTSVWQMVKAPSCDVPDVTLIERAMNANMQNAFLYKLNEKGEACMVFNSDFLGNGCTPIGNYKLNAKEIRAIQTALKNGNYVYYCLLYTSDAADE